MLVFPQTSRTIFTRNLLHQGKCDISHFILWRTVVFSLNGYQQTGSWQAASTLASVVMLILSRGSPEPLIQEQAVSKVLSLAKLLSAFRLNNCTTFLFVCQVF